jgi:O-antigen/teichoic acid export membrane protein
VVGSFALGLKNSVDTHDETRGQRPTAREVDAAIDTDAPSATLLAIRNALKLGGSLIFTWGIALGIRLLVPRYLGPIRFGTLSFADGFSTAAFIVLNLGHEQYIRKEVAVRPRHASDFFGGMFSIRLVMTALVFAGMALVMQLTGRSSEVSRVVFLYGAAQFFVIANASLSAMLHAKGNVGAMSVLAVATKIVWAGGLLAAMATGAGLWAYGASYLASEAIETVVLYRLAQRHLGLTFRVDRAATGAMLLASLPYYLQTFASTAYGKLDVTLLEFMESTEEVGFYGAASALSLLTLLITPLIGWVLMPMLARAVVRSHDEFFEQIRRSLELILTVAIPASMMISLGADFWIHLVFGEAFLPAAPALRIQATVFVLTYVAIIYSIVLVMLDKAWSLTRISIIGLVVNVVLNLALIRPSMSVFGAGGGGAGCAMAMLGTEIVVASLMMGIVGREAFDRRSVVTLSKSLAAYGVVVLVHRGLASLGPLRLVVDGALYLTIVLSTGALRLREMLGVAREAIRNRSK